jgi:hypothetical protein
MSCVKSTKASSTMTCALYPVSCIISFEQSLPGYVNSGPQETRASSPRLQRDTSISIVRSKNTFKIQSKCREDFYIIIQSNTHTNGTSQSLLDPSLPREKLPRSSSQRSANANKWRVGTGILEKTHTSHCRHRNKIVMTGLDDRRLNSLGLMLSHAPLL